MAFVFKGVIIELVVLSTAIRLSLNFNFLSLLLKRGGMIFYLY